jgi:glycosyltransferase involved in cell wall biosynthesis
MADALVFASAEETYPLVLQEAAHLGLPRIVSRFPGWEESVSSSAALLFDVGDVASLSECMRTAIEDECVRDRVAREGLADAAAVTSAWEQDFLGQCHSVLDHPRAVVAPREWL